ncbi:type IV pilus modification PilV family protein [Solirubrobacter soli]|uniref:type IV pilus modification PilV family protein n=1 Tax=Solirubrobacter soli TaxID=363832 RepID=UPI000489A7BB|nr:carboxypeptidase-like regulatory domain-containing protein [Solirubrobacter soli]
MIEVIVSAVVLAIVALAVLSGIDGAQGSSAREKARAVAGALAEQDQERMRSMSVETLRAVPQMAPQTIDGATYTIKSEAQWVTDDTGGTPACGNSSNNAEYFHITTTVTSAITGTRIPPVKIDSLVSPSVAYSQSHGTIGAKIVDRNGNGLAGIAVSGTGPSALGTQVTDQNGCVLWRSVDVGAYTITLSQSGFCDELGNTNVSRDQTVSANTVSFVTVRYDRCSSSIVNVRTYQPGTALSTSSTLASKAREITDISSNGSLKTWTPASGTSASTFTLTNLFPYPSSPYGFFTGECQYQSPAKLGATDYFTTTNPGASITADPSRPNQPAYVYQPPLNMRVTRNSAGTSFAVGSIDVVFTLVKPAAFASDTCTDEVFKYTVMDYPPTGWGTRPSSPNYYGYVSQDSTTYDPGLPYGNYTICLRDKTNNKGVAAGSFDNTKSTAQGLTTIAVSSGWQGTTTC